MIDRNEALQRAAQGRAIIMAYLNAQDKPRPAADVRAHVMPQVPGLKVGDVDNLLSRMTVNQQIGRVPAPPGVKYAYEYVAKPGAVAPAPKLPKAAKASASKPQITVTDHKVVIELATIKITVEV